MRRPDWPARLADAIEAARAAGWDWRGATCLDLLAASAEAITGRPARAVAADLAGGAAPATRREALRVVLRLGGLEPAVARAAEALGFAEIDPADAASGDWGVAQLGEDQRTAEGVLRTVDAWTWRLPGRGVVIGSPGPGWAVRRAWAVA